MMKSTSIFDRLFLLPLFHGMSKEEFLEIAGQVKMGFHTLSSGDIFAVQESKADFLLFVISGGVCLYRNDYPLNLRLTEWASAPMVVEPACLFGSSPRHFRTYLADGEVQILRLDKPAVHRLLSGYASFRLNYFNQLSTEIQRGQHYQWQPTPDTLTSRFVSFVEAKCLRPTGRKELRIRMTDLASNILASRLRVSQMLSSLQEQGLIRSSRETILIPQFEKLRSAYSG